jgi:NADP-dependent 3-hydroxy acid dehydrogenase YdfG
MSQRAWLSTGVSSGFGRQLAHQLLQRGDRVVGTIRDQSKVTDLLERYPKSFHAEVLDMTDTAGIREVVDGLFAQRVADFETQTELAASMDFPPGE